MTYEEYLKKRLDRINQNSHYGIMIDTEITDIVRRHIKRLEEKEMNATSTEVFKDIIAIDFELQTFPNPDVEDKFIVSATNRDDIFCFVFEGPNIVDACRKTGLFAGWEKDQKIRELEEENKDLKKRYDRLNKKFNRVMNNNLPETPITDAMIVNDYNRLVEENKKLEEELGAWKKEAAEYLKDIDKVRRKKNEEINNLKWQLQMKGNIIKRNDELKKELALEKAANEAQHKFIREYAGKGTEVQFNYAIDDTKEVSYVIVDKKTYDEKPNINLHGKDFTPDELVNRVLELEEENNRLKDTAKEGDYVCLGSIPYDVNDIKKLKEKINDLEEQNLYLQKAYDILDKTLDKSQKNCNEWYEKWAEMLSERDCHKKEHEDLKKRYDRLNKKFNRVINDNLQENKRLKQENGELKYILNDIKFTKDLTEMRLNTRADILDQAKKCVCGQREQDYGTPESNFQLIADLWNGYLGSLDYPQWKQIQAKDVAMMMALIKIARIRNGGGSGDSFVDLAGYAACGGEIWALQKETN